MTVRVVVRYDKEGRLSSVEVSGDPAVVYQVLQQLLPLNQAPRAPAPGQAPEPEQPEPPPEPRREPRRRGRARSAQAAQQRAEEGRGGGGVEGLPEFARDNPWLPLLASRAKQS
jgi:hypothetical protein